FFNHKPPYDLGVRLVGSDLCIIDRDGVVAGPTARAILDHIFVPQQASSAAADVPQRDSADAQ
ncbi:hypothetical protein, partial [Klebsiella pneumoniae]|uniref:hypothetical protein n=1 Tax=Klebsiella pneumoniae TaxID=573 RepID=UPI0009CFF601